MPAPARSCGSTGENPKQAGSQQTVCVDPNLLLKNRWPYSSCRTSDSPLGMFVSGSTHIPPMGSHRPARAWDLMREKRSGSSSSTNAYTCAEDWLNVNEG